MTDVAAQGTGDEGFKCTCTKETWPTVLFGMGFGGNVLVCIVAISDIVGGNTAYLVLDAYLFLFGIVGAAAELRQYESLRGVMYYVVKHVYFVARPIGRALFYIFVGSLTWSSEFKLLPWLTAILMMVVALFTIGVELVVGLPIYIDKEVQVKMRDVAANIAANQVRSEIAGGGAGNRI